MPSRDMSQRASVDATAALPAASERAVGDLDVDPVSDGPGVVNVDFSDRGRALRTTGRRVVLLNFQGDWVYAA
jgi:hypothetical protein